ncbi:hypothetical protein EYF80_047350 [Liparis tanakae]|uniref:Uncharacterized protein n=1 Tax=Liparis tanakae TaxID=230148 RepID=A0A4Z2FQ67_9TELE|nr:hypothetical protein EYF80_047350 [Liparis tanakae]
MQDFWIYSVWMPSVAFLFGFQGKQHMAFRACCHYQLCLASRLFSVQRVPMQLVGLIYGS